MTNMHYPGSKININGGKLMSDLNTNLLVSYMAECMPRHFDGLNNRVY